MVLMLVLMQLYYNASFSCICAQAHDVHASLSNTTCAANENVPDTDRFTAQHDFNKFFRNYQTALNTMYHCIRFN